jgi:hypothetical protein
VNTTVNTLYLKVVFLSSEKKGKYSKYRIAKVKDVTGAKHFVTLYGAFRDAVQVDQVFKFNALLVQAYRKEGEKWGRLGTQSSSHIKNVPQNVQDFFAHIGIGDTMLNGTIIAHEHVHFYECCPHCLKKDFKLEGSDACKKCGEQLGDVKTHDFSVNFIVTDTFGGDMVTVTVFRSMLGIDLNKYSEAQTQKMLEKRHMCTCRIEYEKEDGVKHENDSKVIAALKVSFTDEFSDSGIFD